MKLVEGNGVELISKLFHARTQVHIFHLQTLSYAKHKALEEAYVALLEFADGIAEALQKDKILKGYKSFPFKEDVAPIVFLTELRNDLNEKRGKFEAHIDNEIQSLIYALDQTVYKLKFLE